MENIANLEGKKRGLKRRDRARPAPSNANIGLCGRRTGVAIKKYIFKDIDGLENIEDFFQKEVEPLPKFVDEVEDSAVSMSLVTDSEKSISQKSILDLSTIHGVVDDEADVSPSLEDVNATPPDSKKEAGEDTSTHQKTRGSKTPSPFAARTTKTPSPFAARESKTPSPFASRATATPSPFATRDKIPRENRRLSVESATGTEPSGSPGSPFHSPPQFVEEIEENSPEAVETPKGKGKEKAKASKIESQSEPEDDARTKSRKGRKKRAPVSYTGKRKAKTTPRAEGEVKRRKTTPRDAKPKAKAVTPEPVHISLDTFVPSAGEEGVRRGQRRRIPRLDWWKNEKVVYGRRESAIFLPHIVEYIKKD